MSASSTSCWSPLADSIRTRIAGSMAISWRTTSTPEQVGQLEVEDDDVGTGGGRNADRLGAFADHRGHVVAGLGEVAGYCFPPDGMVVYHHHAHREPVRSGRRHRGPAARGSRTRPRCPGPGGCRWSSCRRSRRSGRASTGRCPRRPAGGGLGRALGREAGAVVADGDADAVRLVLQEDPGSGVGAGVLADVVEGGLDRRDHLRRDGGRQLHRLRGGGDLDGRAGQRLQRRADVLRLASWPRWLGGVAGLRGFAGEQGAQRHFLLAGQRGELAGVAAEVLALPVGPARAPGARRRGSSGRGGPARRRPTPA